MNLFRRVSDSLFAPKEVYKYRNDKWYVTALFIIFLVFLSILPSSVNILTNNGLEYEDKKALKMLFNGENIHFNIVDNKLVNKDADGKTYSKKLNANSIILFTTASTYDTSIFNSGVSIIFMEDGVYVDQTVLHQKLFSYEEYQTLNDFDFLSLSNYSSMNWDKIFEVIDSEFLKVKPILSTSSIVLLFFEALFDIFIISFILTIFQALTLSQFIRFTKFWKLAIYLITPYIFGNVLTLLFANGIFHYIGLFTSAIYIIILGRSIIKESMRRE